MALILRVSINHMISRIAVTLHKRHQSLVFTRSPYSSQRTTKESDILGTSLGCNSKTFTRSAPPVRSYHPTCTHSFSQNFRLSQFERSEHLTHVTALRQRHNNIFLQQHHNRSFHTQSPRKATHRRLLIVASLGVTLAMWFWKSTHENNSSGSQNKDGEGHASGHATTDPTGARAVNCKHPIYAIWMKDTAWHTELYPPRPSQSMLKTSSMLLSPSSCSLTQIQ